MRCDSLGLVRSSQIWPPLEHAPFMRRLNVLPGLLLDLIILFVGLVVSFIRV